MTRRWRIHSLNRLDVHIPKTSSLSVCLMHEIQSLDSTGDCTTSPSDSHPAKERRRDCESPGRITRYSNVFLNFGLGRLIHSGRSSEDYFLLAPKRFPYALAMEITAVWTAQQITEAFPWDKAPRYLIRDQDRTYGSNHRYRLTAMGISDTPTEPRSPWQNAYVERVIGSIRRECLSHIIIKD